MASYLTVVIVCIANAICPMQLDDTAGFHTGPPPIALRQCYMRGAEMVKEVAQRMPVLTAVTVCVDVKDTPVAKPEEGKPKKVSPPKVNINVIGPYQPVLNRNIQLTIEGHEF